MSDLIIVSNHLVKFFFEIATDINGNRTIYFN